MKFSLNWMKQYINLDGVTPDEIAEKLTNSGVEVEGFSKLSTATNIVVGKVTTKIPHPDADKLNVCTVNVGKKELYQIVCGAKNVDAGQYVLVALPGAVLPNGMEIKPVKMRGVDSNGMICSLSELGIPKNLIPKNNQEGIYFFSGKETDTINLGEDALKVLGFDDVVFELGLTPNRADCWSYHGLAYEVGAVFNLPVAFNPPSLKNRLNSLSDDIITLKAEKKECSQFKVALLKNVEIKQSPLWMQALLMASGIRPVNNVVDITNYVLLVTGQPLHAYDYDKMENKQIVVRKAKKNETVETLDGEVRKLVEKKDLLITDGKNILGLAGVMGGKSTEVSDTTTNVLLEVAAFDADLVMRTSKNHGLKTDASRRFEKGINPYALEKALRRAINLMVEHASCKLKGAKSLVEDLKPEKEKALKITLAKINSVLGMKLTQEDVRLCLDKLKFNYAEFGGRFIVYLPIRRQDVKITEDLIEEIGRIYGYDNIECKLPSSNVRGDLSQRTKQVRKVKRLIESLGMNEAVTYTLTSKANNELFDYGNVKGSTIELLHPLSSNRKFVRTSLLPHLIDAVKFNVSRHSDEVAIYEIGSKYIKTKDNDYKMSALLGGAIAATKYSMNDTYYYEAKVVLDNVFKELNILDEIEYVPFKDDNQKFHPTRTAQLILKSTGEVIGVIGELHPLVTKEYNIDKTTVFEVNFEMLLEIAKPRSSYVKVSKFPAVSRDIAVTIKRDVLAKDILGAINNSNIDLLLGSKIVDIYEGEHVDTTEKSVTIRLEIGSSENTLTDEQINTTFDKVLENLKTKVNASLR